MIRLASDRLVTLVSFAQGSALGLFRSSGKGPLHECHGSDSSNLVESRLDGKVGRLKPARLSHPSNRPTSSNLTAHTRAREAGARAHVSPAWLYLFIPAVFGFWLDEVRRLDGFSNGAGFGRPTSPSNLVLAGWTE